MENKTFLTQSRSWRVEIDQPSPNNSQKKEKKEEKAKKYFRTLWPLSKGRALGAICRNKVFSFRIYAVGLIWVFGIQTKRLLCTTRTYYHVRVEIKKSKEM